MLSWLLFAACTPEPVVAQAPPTPAGEMDHRPGGRVTADGWEAVVAPGGQLRVGDRVLAERVDPRMALRGDRLIWAQEGPLKETELWSATLPDGVPERLVGGPGNNDRPVLSPDGERVAFVSSRSGLAAWWVLEAGALRQLTNASLGSRRPTGPPEGWTPVPDGRDYGWDEAGLHWVADGRAWRVAP